MSLEAIVLLALVALTLALFVSEWLAPEITALGLLGVLVLTGIVPAAGALEGFSSKAVVAIGGLFVLGHALTRTGLLETLADWLTARTPGRPWLAAALLVSVAALLSGMLNNTAVVAVFIPLVMDVCRRSGVSPSKVLIPLSYAVVCGGMLTLIGTSTNLLVSDLLEGAGQPPLAMFELTRLGWIYLVIGLAYVLLAGPRFLPSRAAAGVLTRKYRMGSYLAEVRLTATSSLVGSSPREARLRERYGVTVLTVQRGERRVVVDLAGLELLPDDVLVVHGVAEDLLRLRNEQNLALLTDVELDDRELAADDQLIVEALVTPRSELLGRTLREANFRRHYGAFVLAVARQAELLHAKTGDIALSEMDSLLLLVPRQKLETLRASADLLVLTEGEHQPPSARRAALVTGVLVAVVALASAGVLEIAVGALIGAVVVVAAGVVTPREAYRAVDWSVLLLIAAFVPVGEAFASTGAAAALASGLVGAAGYFPDGAAPYLLIALLYLGVTLLTEIMSNSAAAIIATPIALASAAPLGLDPRALVIAVCFAASAAFMTPTGYQTNLMVYSPGAYRFLDFVRFGAPLNLVLWLVGSLLIPIFWPM